MFIHCPACGSFNIRRSARRSSETNAWLRAPYRCRDCAERFWVVTRRTYFLAGVGALAVAAGMITWSVVGAPDAPRKDPPPAAVVVAAVTETLKLAQQGDPAAEYKLSQMYGNGAGVELNRQEARRYLERAAEHGNAEAQYDLGNALREGTGVIQDYAAAVKWLQLSAESGNGDAQYALGQMYRSGMGVPVDNAKAYIWFNLAAARDVAGAVVQRDSALKSLSPSEVLEAQAEARRLNENPLKPGATAPSP